MFTIRIKNLSYSKLNKINQKIFLQMETLEKIKTLTEELSQDATKFFKGNKSAGTRARKSAQELKALLQTLRTEILEHKKNEQ